MAQTKMQVKTNFSKKSQAYTHDLRNKILELNPTLPSYHQQIDSILATKDLLKDVATNAGLYIPDQSFAAAIDNFDHAIKQFYEHPNRLDESSKQLLFEVIDIFNQIISEYYLGINLSTDWMGLQNDQFAKITEHLDSAVNESVVLEMPEDISGFNGDLDDPFSLDNTPEGFHLFDLDFNFSNNFSIQNDAPANLMEEIDHLDSFLMIHLDQDDNYTDNSIDSSLDYVETDVDESMNLFSNISVNDFAEDFAEDFIENIAVSSADEFANDFREDLGFLDFSNLINIDTSEQENQDIVDDQNLPMPEVLAQIFLVSDPDPTLGNDDQTELVGFRQNDLDKNELGEDKIEDGEVNMWEQFNMVDDWSNNGLNDDQEGLEINVEDTLSLLPELDFDAFINDDYDYQNISQNISEDISLEDSFEFDFDQQPVLDLDNILSIFNEPDQGHELIFLESKEPIKEEFSKDIDTCIEESPIYQNSQSNPTKSREALGSEWDELSLINLGANTISYEDFAALSLDKKDDSQESLKSSSLQVKSRSNDGTIRIPLHHLGMLENLSEEILMRRGGLDIYLHELNVLSKLAQQNLETIQHQDNQAIANLQITVERIVNVLALSEQQTLAMSEDVCHLRKSLQQVLKHPISTLVKKFPRILRDLSVQSGKQVELFIQGAEIEIERLVSEAIADPLEMLMRNAFEHGIESPNQRQQAGKSSQGKIEFIVTQNEQNTIIKVIDDGCGLDIDKIRSHVEQSAAIAGVSGFSTMEMNDQHLMGMIFESNFTDAGTTLSTLKKKLNKLGGSISVQSQMGKGAEFTLVLPNSISLIRVLLIDINQMCLAIPSKMVLEVIPREPINQGEEEPKTLLWRDRTLPIVNIDALLKLNCRQNLGNLSPDQAEFESRANTSPSFLVIHYEDDLFALQTNGCWHDQEATFHQIEGDISLPNILLGAAILGNNQAIPLINYAELVNQGLYSDRVSPIANQIINYPHLDNLSGLSDFFNMGDDLPQSNLMESLAQLEISSAKSSHPQITEQNHIQSNPQIRRSHDPKVLIVESSANVRRYLAMTLARSGFLTEQVQDGAEAIAFLRQRFAHNSNIDVVITDLEMPRMDGFKLLASIREDPELQKLPIVVLSGKNNENDQKLALDLGANAYFSKPYREEELVKTLLQLVN
jgi:chemotaxis protein histidine kinase CheA/CheY-like chemotaxis protein